MFNNISLRVSLAIGIITMGFLGIMLSLYVGESSRQVAIDNQRVAYEDIVRLHVDDQIKSLKKYSKDLGQSVQNNNSFRTDLLQKNIAPIEAYLKQHFHQYFVTAGVLKLNSLTVLDPDLKFIGMDVSEEIQDQVVGGISCGRLHEKARQRVGSARLKTISAVCVHRGYPYVHVLIPIGGLRVLGYLEVVTDPTYSVIAIEESLGLPLMVSRMDDSVVYKSPRWDDENSTSITASYTVHADSGKGAFQVFIKRDIRTYQAELDANRNVLTATAIVITFIIAAFMLFFVKRTTLDPLRELGCRVAEIQKDSSMLGDEFKLQGNKEVRELTSGFQEMTSDLKSLYDEVHSKNRDLKDQIKERERAEIELKISRDHLEELVDKRTSDLAIARDTALNASRSKSRFLANMSHELRTPLNAIIGYTEIMLDDARGAQNQELVLDLNKVFSASQHLLKLIRDILDLSKIEAGKMEITLEDFDVRSLIEETVSTVLPIIEKQNNIIEVDCHDDVSTMYADAIKLRQALLNLLSNAGKFTSDGKIILTVRCEEEKESRKILFSVSDTGIGLSNDEITKVFQAFTQADTSLTRQYGGTGLGLAISRNYCLMMGGELTVKSEKGVGSTFSIVLPAEVKSENLQEYSIENVSDIPNPTALRINRQQENDQQKGSDRRKKVSTVLIIDDDPSVCELVSRYLVTKGYKSVTASNGQEGIKFAREIEPDAILLDVLMSGMDGWEVLSNLKQDVILKEVPVVMMSIIDDKNMGYALGASDYIVKPIDRSILFKVVNKCVRRKKQGPILLIKDDNDMRSTMAEILSDDGWKVIGANNNFIAFDLASRETPSLIVVDSGTHEFDVVKYVEKLKQNVQTKEIPIILTDERGKDSSYSDLGKNVSEMINEDADNTSLLMEKVFEFIHEHIEKSDTLTKKTVA